MAVKTITIDLDAYEALKRRKRQGQSFSDVIKEHFTRGTTAAALRRAVQGLDVDESTLAAVDALLRDRASDLAGTEPL
ncbi:MAG: antitoxin VapB family protein [Longimicrobiales bacterium]|nr:antitoxin VapB family protein [Longimicrobiales bacterium]